MVSPIMISAGNTGMDEPPGITAFSLCPLRTPPAISSNFAERRAHRHFEIAGIVDMAGNGKQLGAAVVGLAQFQEFLPAMTDDVGNAGKGFGVVDGGRLAVQAESRGERRLEARLAFLAFDGFQQGGFFAADISTITQMVVQVETEIRAQNVVAQITGGARLFAGLLHAFVGFEDFAMHVVVAGLDAHGVGGDRHAFDELMRVEAQDVPVLAGARLAFVASCRRYTCRPRSSWA